MLHNPLVNKEFRQRMRTIRAPIVLTGYLASMVLLTFVLLYENVQGQLFQFQPARSEQVFFVLSLLQMTVAAFLTPAFAAGSISGERERRTLSVLLTTPLSPWTILFGKVLSSSALLGLMLVITLPLYSLVFLFGGAVPQEVASVLLFQLFTIVLIAAISVMWSTIALRSGWSTVLAYATVSWMVLITGVIGYGLDFISRHSPIEFFAASWSRDILSLNPLWIEASLEKVVQARPHALLMFVGFYLLVAVVLTIPGILRLRPQVMKVWPRLRSSSEKKFQ